ncbi:hypothetical protein RK21_05031 [Pseudomonas plecoglossicida]|uniref:Uncharacterized protein n=1 Tax=Pseudomonas taiwanensis SJ9 TaxID=1388762 RepID=V7DIZ1_9PSED|nr:hypothetical protein RK21_05031 [Pseudomonas plecoglossicida]ESW41468.1 hypothetical protein O164_00410 [Pseudomonas taiwanensis SJ9]
MALQGFWFFMDFALHEEQLLEVNCRAIYRGSTDSNAVHIKVSQG